MIHIKREGFPAKSGTSVGVIYGRRGITSIVFMYKGKKAHYWRLRWSPSWKFFHCVWDVE